LVDAKVDEGNISPDQTVISEPPADETSLSEDVSPAVPDAPEAPSQDDSEASQVVEQPPTPEAPEVESVEPTPGKLIGILSIPSP